VSWARGKNLPIFVLGGGSNTLVPDEGFAGLVIKIEIKGSTYVGMHGGVRATVGAGEVWDDFVRDAVLRDVWGIENLSLIPGSVGGAAVQNIGAYGVEIRETIAEVEAFDIGKNKINLFPGHKCKFGYRDSIFKNDKNLIVTHVVFNLAHSGKPRTDYEDVKIYFGDKGTKNPTIQNIRDAIIEIRTAKMPAVGTGTAGSFFKNPVIPVALYESLKKQFPEIKAHLQGDNTAKLSAAWLLDKLGGFRGVRHGDAGVSEKQALILVNHGSAKASEIILLANEMKQSIKEKTNVTLEEEVVIL
jgi:UDP-N-acetylmuramate dehydrogenase